MPLYIEWLYIAFILALYWLYIGFVGEGDSS